MADFFTVIPWICLLLVFGGMLALCWKLASGQHDLSTLLAQALAGFQPGAVPAPTARPAPPLVPLPVPAPKPAVLVPTAPPVAIHDSPQIAALKAANARRWAAMHVKADKIAEFDATAAKLCASAAKVRYQKISSATGVPWYAIAVIHEREAAGRFNAQLGQGDPLDQVSIHTPTGRGPFLNHSDDPPGEDAFYRSALDALIDCSPYASKWKDWSIGGLLTLLEEYNGLGYANMGVPSAYVWSGSDQYVAGKYVADHVYSATALDVQEGCAPMLARMAALDPTIILQPTPP
jgi:lysozyme family protein